MEELKIKLDVFEGPLDLLLHLIKTLEIDIYDIPIAEITEQYMAYIRSMQLLDLEVAGEYIVMAATLMSIKSKMLLPQVAVNFDDDEIYEEDPREKLVNQLLEYRKFKYAATILKEREEEREGFFTKEATNLDEYRDEVPKMKPNEVTIIDLFLAFHDVVNRKELQEPIEVNVTSDTYTIEDKMNELLTTISLLDKHETIDFVSLFKMRTKTEVVTTFMAMLELMKDGKIRAYQENINEPIQLACC